MYDNLIPPYYNSMRNNKIPNYNLVKICWSKKKSREGLGIIIGFGILFPFVELPREVFDNPMVSYFYVIKSVETEPIIDV